MIDVNSPSWSPYWYQCKTQFIDKFKNAGTRTYYAVQLNNFLSTLKSPELCTSADIQAFIHSPCANGKRNAGAQPKQGTINVRISVIKAFYKYAASYRVLDADGKPTSLISWNPAENFQVEAYAHEPRGLSLAEIAKFFKAINEADVSPLMRLRDRAIFYFMLASGRRIGEVTQLTIGDFARQVISDEHGVAHEADVYSFVPEKKRRAKRVALELAPSAMQCLREYWNARQEHQYLTANMPAFTIIGGKGCEHVWKSWGDPFTGLGIHAIARRMHSYCNLAELDPSLSPHAWRHTAAQQMLLNGESLFSISHILQHSSVAQTELYLGKLHTPVMKSVDRFEASFAHLAN